MLALVHLAKSLMRLPPGLQVLMKQNFDETEL